MIAHTDSLNCSADTLSSVESLSDGRQGLLIYQAMTIGVQGARPTRAEQAVAIRTTLSSSLACADSAPTVRPMTTAVKLFMALKLRSRQTQPIVSSQLHSAT
jgi:hypothetical protein